MLFLQTTILPSIGQQNSVWSILSILSYYIEIICIRAKIWLKKIFFLTSTSAFRWKFFCFLMHGSEEYNDTAWCSDLICSKVPEVLLTTAFVTIGTNVRSEKGKEHLSIIVKIVLYLQTPENVQAIPRIPWSVFWKPLG